MTGTLVNCIAVVLGGLIGILLKKGIKESHAESINKVLGLAVLIIGINGVISNMFTAENGKITDTGVISANRNGHYRFFAVHGNDSVKIKIEIEQE